MNLQSWLLKSGTSKADLAERLGVTQEAVRLWCAGYRFPRKKHILAIAKESGGKVRVIDFYAEDQS